MGHIIILDLFDIGRYCRLIIRKLGLNKCSLQAALSNMVEIREFVAEDGKSLLKWLGKDWQQRFIANAKKGGIERILL